METPLWVQMWEMKLAHVVVFSLFLILITLLMVFRDRVSKRKRTLDLLRYGILAVSFVYVGLIVKAQPTTTNVIILVHAMKDFQFPIQLYLMEPFIFMLFIFMSVTFIVWGRGVFCGWLCPYGAMLELINKLYRGLFKKGSLSLPRRVHNKLIYLKYIILLVLLGVSLSTVLSSQNILWKLNLSGHSC